MRRPDQHKGIPSTIDSPQAAGAAIRALLAALPAIWEQVPRPVLSVKNVAVGRNELRCPLCEFAWPADALPNHALSCPVSIAMAAKQALDAYRGLDVPEMGQGDAALLGPKPEKRLGTPLDTWVPKPSKPELEIVVPSESSAMTHEQRTRHRAETAVFPTGEPGSRAVEVPQHPFEVGQVWRFKPKPKEWAVVVAVNGNLVSLRCCKPNCWCGYEVIQHHFSKFTNCIMLPEDQPAAESIAR